MLLYPDSMTRHTQILSHSKFHFRDHVLSTDQEISLISLARYVISVSVWNGDQYFFQIQDRYNLVSIINILQKSMWINFTDKVLPNSKRCMDQIWRGKTITGQSENYSSSYIYFAVSQIPPFTDCTCSACWSVGPQLRWKFASGVE